MKTTRFLSLIWIALAAIATASARDPQLIRSARSGPWSAAATWADGGVPAAGDSVQIRAGDVVTYDLDSTQAIRAIFIAGRLSFTNDRDTRLDVGLIKIQAGDGTSEEGFDCDAHLPDPDPSKPLPALEVGTWEKPVPAEHTPIISERE